MTGPTHRAAAPALTFEPELLLAAQGMRVAFFDVDGVLTDGGVYFAADGEALKRFHILDGLGIKLLLAAGIEPVIITGRDSPAVRARMAGLGIRHAHYGCEDKATAAEATLGNLGQHWGCAAAIGDDWPDLPVLARAAFAVCPPGAHAEVRAACRHITRTPGGHGAAREFCDLLLVAGGHYAGLLARYR